MIDTDKYEGHTEGEWRWYEGARHKSLAGSMRLLMFAEDGNNEHPKPADAALIADAPLFLEEVKRLREEKTFLWETYLKESAEVKRLREVERTLMRLVTPYVSTAQIEKALKELIE